MDRIEKMKGKTILLRKSFRHSNYDLEEIIVEDWDGKSKCKLIWCYDPFEKMMINGRQNLLYHMDFVLVWENGVLNFCILKLARQRVRESFNQVHQIDYKKRGYPELEGWEFDFISGYEYKGVG